MADKNLPRLIIFMFCVLVAAALAALSQDIAIQTRLMDALLLVAATAVGLNSNDARSKDWSVHQ